jgi:hypothetical protein
VKPFANGMPPRWFCVMAAPRPRRPTKNAPYYLELKISRIGGGISSTSIAEDRLRSPTRSSSGSPRSMLSKIRSEGRAPSNAALCGRRNPSRSSKA